jgi:hypothetical protein
MEMMISAALGLWSLAISVVLSIIGYAVREKLDKIKELDEKLNATRVEVARDNVTQAEIDKIMVHIDQRFNKLEAKIDQLIQKGLVA